MDGLNQISNLQVGQAATGGSGAGKTDAAAGGPSFKDVLMQNLNEVNQMQQDADKSIDDFVTGKSQNMGDVITATQKASMAFSMLTQIRNKMQDAYDELKNLHI